MSFSLDRLSATTKRWIVATVTMMVAVGVVHRVLMDGLDGWLLARVYGDDTEYAQGYSDRAFKTIRSGMSESDVVRVLGEPIGEAWVYASVSRSDRTVLFINSKGRLEHVSDNTTPRTNLDNGMSRDDVVRLIGAPAEKNLAYTRSRHGGSYRERLVRIQGSVVSQRIQDYYLD